MRKTKKVATEALPSKSLVDQRVLLLEQALIEYVERYGLTDKAREAFQVGHLRK